MPGSKYCCLLIPVCLLLLSCAGPNKLNQLILPGGLDSNFISGQVKPGVFKGNLEIFEYRAFSDSLIKSGYKDSALTFGLIIPRSSVVASASERKMLFGSDSLQCSIRYIYMDLYKTEDQSSLLMDILLPPDKKAPGYNEYEKTINTYQKVVTGFIQGPSSEPEAAFYFEHTKAKIEFDSSRINGYIKSGNDSFFIKPLFNVIHLHGKNVKPMFVLQGYCLMKKDTLYAFLQHAPMVKYLFKVGLKDVLFLNSKASTTEQMLMAAYFSLVSRLVFNTSKDILY